MAGYSKLLPYTCYEVGHTWHPSCAKCSFDMFISAGYMSLRLYAVAYFLTLLISKQKFSKSYFKQMLKQYLQSSLFLAFNGSFFVSSFCFLRLLYGFTLTSFVIQLPSMGLITRRISFFSLGFLPGFIASVLSIYVERVSRRSQLAVYVCNVASETFWNVLKARGYVTAIPKGEVLLFSSAMAFLGYFYKSKTNFGFLLNTILKSLIGKDESGDVKKLLVSSLVSQSSPARDFDWRHPMCPHHNSCIRNALRGALFAGLKGYVFQVLFKIYTTFSKLGKRPFLLLQILGGSSTLKCAAAFAWFSSAFRLTCCLARRFSNDDKPWHGAYAGTVAGLALALYPSTTLAIYTSWKALEAIYEHGIEVGYLPVIPHGIEVIFAFSTAYLYHVAVLESFNMKPSYWRFLMDLSAGKIGEYNTSLLDCYGLDSGRNHVWPSYDKRYLSKEFIEKFSR